MLNIIATPFGYLLKFCYDLTQSYAVALILFTLLFKLILLPLNIKQQKSQVAQARVKPIEKAIRKRYEGRTDPDARIELSNDLMKMYKEEKVNAAGGCLTLLIQLPIIWILWEIIKNPLTYICRIPSAALADIRGKIYSLLGSGVLNPSNTPQSVINLAASAESAEQFKLTEIETATILRDNLSVFSDFLGELGLSGITLPNFRLFGVIDLSANPTFSFSVLILIPLFAAIFQFLSTKVISAFSSARTADSPEAAQAAKTVNSMNIVFPFLTFFLALKLPAIIGLYWIYQSIFGMIIQVALYKMYPEPVYTEEDYKRIEAEVNKDFVYTAPEKKPQRSLHNIDEDEDDGSVTTEESEPEDDLPPEPETPARRLYDKNGNKIRSLHYIDEEDDIPEPDISKDVPSEEKTEDEEKNEDNG